MFEKTSDKYRNNFETLIGGGGRGGGGGGGGNDGGGGGSECLPTCLQQLSEHLDIVVRSIVTAFFLVVPRTAYPKCHKFDLKSPKMWAI